MFEVISGFSIGHCSSVLEPGAFGIMFLSPVAYGSVVSNLDHSADGFCQGVAVCASCCVNRDERCVSVL